MKKVTVPALPASVLNIMHLLRNNNNREWFAANKELYLQEVTHVEIFAEAILQELNRHDVIETPSGKKKYLSHLP